MFALVLFSDNVYYICKKVNIIEGKNSCSIKYKDGKRYAGKVIACKENYKELVILKLKFENESRIENGKQLICNSNVHKRKLRTILLEDKENLRTKNIDMEAIKKKKIKKKHIITQVSTDRHGRDESDQNRDVSNIVENIVDENMPKISNNIVSIDKHGKDESSQNRNVSNIVKDTLNKIVPEVSNNIVSIDKHSKDKSDQNRDISNIVENTIDENMPKVFNNIVSIDKHDKDESSQNRNVSNIVKDTLKKIVPEVSNNIVSIDKHGKDESDQNRNMSNIVEDIIGENVHDVPNNIGAKEHNTNSTESPTFDGTTYNPKDDTCQPMMDIQNALDFNIDIGQLLNSTFVNNSDTNGEILILPYNLQAEQSTAGLIQNMDTVHCDDSLENISFPARFNLRNIQEDEDKDNKSNITSNSKSSSDSSYIPNSDASEESDVEDKNISKASTKNGNRDLSKASHSTTLETSFPLGHSVPDDTNMFVQNVGCGNKRDFCVYCQTEQTKLSRHLIRIHKNEKEVKDIMYIPKGHPERRILINKIRKNGQYLFNTNSDINIGELKVMRRPNSKQNKNATDFSICPQCKGSYSKSAIRHHYQRCSKKNSAKRRSILSKSRRITCRIHESASKILRDRVFPTMKDDSVSKVIRYDELAIDFGNKLCEKYHDPHFYDMIRQKLRQTGRLLLEMKNQNDKIDNLFTIFVPDNYDDCLRAIRTLAGLNESGTGFKTPSLATSLGTLLKQVCKRCITIMIKRRDKIKRKLAEQFLSLLTEDYTSSIARTAIETQFRKKRQSTILLPTRDDIKKLETYLSDRMKTAYDSLKKKFSVNAWEALAETCLLSIQLFNRRRPGEIERALIEDFQNYQKVNKDTIGTAYVSLNNDEKKAADKYVRFTMRGKLGRTVPVLLHMQMLENLQLLLSYRKTANVHSKNPYLFGVSGILKGDYRYLRACDLMRRYSEECGASNPDRLRGTNLRKHIATMCINLNLRDHEISDLANFMGHADKIHKEHYRQPILSREIFHVSKLLEIVHGKDSDKEIDESDEEQSDFRQNVSSHSLDFEETNANENNTDESLSANNSSSFSQVTHKNKKKRSTSPIGRCIRKRWTKEEKNIAYTAFKHHIASRTQPSFKEIQKLKDANPGVFNRNCATIKTWVSNQIKKQKQQ